MSRSSSRTKLRKNDQPRCPSSRKQTTLNEYFTKTNGAPSRKRHNLDKTDNNVSTRTSDVQNEFMKDDTDSCKLSKQHANGNHVEYSQNSDYSDAIPPSPNQSNSSKLVVVLKNNAFGDKDETKTRSEKLSYESESIVSGDAELRTSHNVSESENEEMNVADTDDNRVSDQDMSDEECKDSAKYTLGYTSDVDETSSQATEKYSQSSSPPTTRLHSMKTSYNRKNIDFYMNKFESVPRGAKIDDMLDNWKGDYYKLEVHHGYIQWLFPIRESGMNMSAQTLQDDEAKFLRNDKYARRRIIRAYSMMLDFFGIELVNKNTGELRRARNWKERLYHLNNSSHNFLRITRMLKFFGEVGLDHLQAPLVKFLIDEVFKYRTLKNARRSCHMFWVTAVTSETRRNWLEQLMKDLDSM